MNGGRKVPVPVARERPGKTMTGLDGNLYISRVNKNGVYRWYKQKPPSSPIRVGRTNTTAPNPPKRKSRSYKAISYVVQKGGKKVLKTPMRNFSNSMLGLTGLKELFEQNKVYTKKDNGYKILKDLDRNLSKQFDRVMKDPNCQDAKIPVRLYREFMIMQKKFIPSAPKYERYRQNHKIGCP